MADSAPHKESSDEFIVRLVGCQNRLYAYVYSLMPNAEQARDVVQEANLIIWRKAAEFEAGTNFEAWACKIAYFEVLACPPKKTTGAAPLQRGIGRAIGATSRDKIVGLQRQGSGTGGVPRANRSPQSGAFARPL